MWDYSWHFGTFRSLAGFTVGDFVQSIRLNFLFQECGPALVPPSGSKRVHEGIIFTFLTSRILLVDLR